MNTPLYWASVKPQPFASSPIQSYSAPPMMVTMRRSYDYFLYSPFCSSTGMNALQLVVGGFLKGLSRILVSLASCLRVYWATRQVL